MGEFRAADHNRSVCQGSDFSFPEEPLLPGGNMPRRRRERGNIPQPSILEGQPAYSQSGCPRRGKGQRKHLRNCVSRLVPRLGSAQAIGAMAHPFCGLIWIVLHHGVCYEEREPAVSKSSRRTRTAKMIRELRLLGYRIEPLSVPPANPA